MATQDLEFYTPVRDRGRAVTVSYAATPDGRVIRRRHAGGPAAAVYHIAPAAPDDREDYWNGAPTPAGGWVALEPAALQRYGLN